MYWFSRAKLHSVSDGCRIINAATALAFRSALRTFVFFVVCAAFFIFETSAYAQVTSEIVYASRNRANNNIYEINPVTGLATLVDGFPNKTSAIGLGPDGLIYYLNDAHQLGKWNPSNNANQLLPLTLPGLANNAYLASAFDSSGTLYVVNDSQELYQIDVNSSPPTYILLGTISGTSGLPGDITFGSDGTLFLVDEKNRLYSVNRSSLIATFIGDIPGVIGGQPTGLTMWHNSQLLVSSNGHLAAISTTDASLIRYIGQVGNGLSDLAGSGVFSDLSITKIANESTIVVGENVVFTITVTNAGPHTVQAIEVTDVLPLGLTYVSDNGGGTYNSTSGVWSPTGSIPSGSSISLQITAVANTVGTHTNGAEITSSSSLDPDSDPNVTSSTEDDRDAVVVTVVIDNCPADPQKIDPEVCGCGVPDTDSDGDGTPDCNDNCPSDALKTAPGTCGCGIPDTDSDGDGTPDCNDQCQNDASKTAPGTCGCGTLDTDSDGDGTPDCIDNCPSDANKTAPGACGCGVPDTDSDGDGTPDCNDQCPNDASKTAPGTCGCGTLDTDSDGDGAPNCSDNCPLDSNVGQKDTDGDSFGDACDADSDNDGIPNIIEGTGDADGDGIPNIIDLDSDNDGISDIIEGGGTDTDGDGLVDDFTDASPKDGLDDIVAGSPLPVPDTDGDGLPNFLDIDSDNDGILDRREGSKDFDNDGNPNYLDIDSDDDGVPDIIEAGGTDTDGNAVVDGFKDTATRDGLHDNFALSPLPVPDTDGDGFEDYLDIDTDADGIVDNIEAQSTADYVPPLKVDSDSDGLDDAYDSDSTGSSPLNNPEDKDGDKTPDYIDLDTDNDTVPDRIEGHDANQDGIADKTPTNSDSDRDGLDDAYDNFVGPGVGNSTGSNSPLQNTDGIDEPDWRDVNDDADAIDTKQEDVDGNGDPTNDDSDNDGRPDYLDLCNNDSSNDVDGDAVCADVDTCPNKANSLQTDSDGDGVGDVCELCPNDAKKTTPGACGCGVTDADTDGDGTLDCEEKCPDDPNKTTPGICGCGLADTDSDTDGTPECKDECPNDPKKSLPGACGCGVVDIDFDGDGIPNCNDQCPNDAANDVDADGVCGNVDNCSNTANANQKDIDGDGVGDACQGGQCDPNSNTDCIFEQLKPMGCAGVNGFLGQVNILTVINLQKIPLQVQVQYRDLFGVVQGVTEDTILPLLKKDFSVNALGLEPDTYGTACVETDATVDGAWVGSTTLYKPNTRVGQSGLEFALTYPVTNPRTGAYTLPLNTFHLGVDSRSTVANWIRITDGITGDGFPLKGRIDVSSD